MTMPYEQEKQQVLDDLYERAGDPTKPVTAMRTSFVATRGQVCNGLVGASVQAQSASVHVMQSDVDEMEFEFANWYVTNVGVETAPGAIATIEFYLEYPIFSTPRRIQFDNGSGTYVDQGSIPNGGSIKTKAQGKFRKGTAFRVLVYRTCASGCVYHGGGSALHLGEKGQFAASVSNTISTGVIGGSDYTNYYAPIAITGRTRRRTVAILGDSIYDGYTPGVGGELSSGFGGDRGVIARSLGKDYAYSCLAVPSDRATYFLASNAKRLAVALLASDIWVGYGRNDLGSGARTGAQLNTDMASIAALLPNKRLYTTTLLPWSTSSDSWATSANQTAAAEAAHIATVNTERMKRLSPWVYCADLYTITSDRSGPFTPKWKVDGSLAIAKFYTPDGTHPSERCCNDIERSGLIRLI